MVEFENVDLDIESVKKTDIFICAIGYEERSQYLLNRIKDRIDANNILVFFYEDYEKHPDVKKFLELLNEKIFRSKKKYSDGNIVKQEIIAFLNEHYIAQSHVHIDYSSMPRNWYYQLPLSPEILEKKGVYYWYVGGKYPISYDAYPSAGIEGYAVIGRPSLRIENKRLHVIGLGFDTVRTKALITILDPDMYSVCAAFGSGDKEVEEHVYFTNSQIISRANAEISLRMDDFPFMVAKLCEIAIEFLPIGDVIFVPDGPKPLIMAMSLVPLILNREGISCLHVARNTQFYEPVPVESSKSIWGFQVKEYL